MAQRPGQSRDAGGRRPAGCCGEGKPLPAPPPSGPSVPRASLRAAGGARADGQPSPSWQHPSRCPTGHLKSGHSAARPRHPRPRPARPLCHQRTCKRGGPPGGGGRGAGSRAQAWAPRHRDWQRLCSRGPSGSPRASSAPPPARTPGRSPARGFCDTAAAPSRDPHALRRPRTCGPKVTVTVTTEDMFCSRRDGSGSGTVTPCPTHSWTPMRRDCRVPLLPPRGPFCGLFSPKFPFTGLRTSPSQDGQGQSQREGGSELTCAPSRRWAEEAGDVEP